MADSRAVPKWKRALEDVESSSPTASKKQKPNLSLETALLDLEKGLTFVEYSQDIPEEAKQHAQMLRKLVLNTVSTANPVITKVLFEDDGARIEQIRNEAKSDHTDVPPPFPVNQNSISIPNSQASNGNSKPKDPNHLPPLPPITDLTLLSAPFTHLSALPHYMPATNTNTYEPLEFLGDAYLELIATRLIHERFPQYSVGQKAQLRELLVKNETLAVYSKAYRFDERIKYKQDSKFDPKSKAWIKVQADVFEAYVACVILSDNQHGFNICEHWLWELWEPKIQEWKTGGSGQKSAEEEHANTDMKSMLQRYVVTKGVRLEYLEEKPMEHVKEGNKTTFFIGVYLTGWSYNKLHIGSGNGRSKVIAGAEAAKDAFTRSAAVVEECHQRKLEFDRTHHSHNSHRS